MTFHVRTTAFEGPLDLLLQLITRHQIEITAVGLTDVVGEYLELLDEMKKLDLDATSEFLLIAATLIQLKAQSLLPGRGDIDIDDELALIEERDRLLARLLACVTFKDVAAVLRHRLAESSRFVPRISGMDQPIRLRPPVVGLPIGPAELAALAVRALSRAPEEPDLDHLDLELPSVAAAIEDIRDRVQASVMSSFEDLVHHCRRPIEVAAYFLALLEMARWGLVEVSQRDWLEPIEVRPLRIDDVDLTSEWAT